MSDFTPCDDFDGGVALATVAVPDVRHTAAVGPMLDLSGVSDDELVRIEHVIRARDAREGAGEP